MDDPPRRTTRFDFKTYRANYFDACFVYVPQNCSCIDFIMDDDTTSVIEKKINEYQYLG